MQTVTRTLRCGHDAEIDVELTGGESLRQVWDIEQTSIEATYPGGKCPVCTKRNTPTQAEVLAEMATETPGPYALVDDPADEE